MVEFDDDVHRMLNNVVHASEPRKKKPTSFEHFAPWDQTKRIPGGRSESTDCVEGDNGETIAVPEEPSGIKARCLKE